MQVCAKDYCGNETCDWKTVGVPIKYTDQKLLQQAVNDGALYLVAQERGFWNALPDGFPYRARATPLTGPAVGLAQANYGWPTR